MNYKDIVIFHWKTPGYKRLSFKTTTQDFKFHATELLEDEMLGKIKDVWYTYDNVTKKLDYYNSL